MSQQPPTHISPAELHVDSFSDDEPEVAAYAVLRFPDCNYFVKTQEVTLGRDMALDHFLNKSQGQQLLNRSGSEVPSEERVGTPDNSDEDDEDGDAMQQEQLQASLKGGICNPQKQNVSNEDAIDHAFLAVHPQWDEEQKTFLHLRAISKRHLHFYLGEETWVMHVMGRNGVRKNGIQINREKRVHVHDGDRIELHGLGFEFRNENIETGILSELDDNDVSSGESVDSDDQSDSSGSYDSKQPAALQSVEAQTPETSPDEAARSSTKKTVIKLKVKDQEETPDGKGERRSGGTRDSEAMARALLRDGEEIPKKRGVGRPPANGVMSKREMRERQKAKRELEMQGKTATDTELDAATRAASSRAAEAANADHKPGTKRGHKRKRSGSDPEDDKDDGSDSEVREGTPKPKKEDFTAEQLANPNLTYATMIHKVLLDSQPQAMNLQQIYKAIMKKWPHFYFRETHGWQSSVRHTVKQKHFTQGDKDGKGYKYSINPAHPPPEAKAKATATSTTAAMPRPQPTNGPHVNGVAPFTMQGPHAYHGYGPQPRPPPYPMQYSNMHGSYPPYMNGPGLNNAYRPPPGPAGAQQQQAPYRPGGNTGYTPTNASMAQAATPSQITAPGQPSRPNQSSPLPFAVNNVQGGQAPQSAAAHQSSQSMRPQAPAHPANTPLRQSNTPQTPQPPPISQASTASNTQSQPLQNNQPQATGVSAAAPTSAQVPAPSPVRPSSLAPSQAPAPTGPPASTSQGQSQGQAQAQSQAPLPTPPAQRTPELTPSEAIALGRIPEIIVTFRNIMRGKAPNSNSSTASPAPGSPAEGNTTTHSSNDEDSILNSAIQYAIAHPFKYNNRGERVDPSDEGLEGRERARLKKLVMMLREMIAVRDAEVLKEREKRTGRGG